MSEYPALDEWKKKAEKLAEDNERLKACIAEFEKRWDGVMPKKYERRRAHFVGMVPDISDVDRDHAEKFIGNWLPELECIASISCGCMPTGLIWQDNEGFKYVIKERKFEPIVC